MVSTLPVVSVVIPCRNEERYIEVCVRSVLSQVTSFPVEVLVVDGMSEEQTRPILRKLEVEHPGRVRMIDNPERTTPYALNHGITNARGSYVMIVGAHSEMLPGYLEGIFQSLERNSGAGYAGGFIEIVGRGVWGRAIALGLSSRFGVGGSGYRTKTEPGYLDTVAFGMYRKEVFDQMGLFDVTMTRNQDDEFNYRLLKAGIRGYFEPKCRMRYFSRQDLRALFRQYYYYGFFKPLTYAKTGLTLRLRHLVPLGFVVGVILGMLAGLLLDQWWVLLLVLAPYLTMTMLEVVRSALGHGPAALLLPVVFVVLHISYGTGSGLGLLNLLRTSSRP